MLLCGACKKDEAGTPPVVEILLPGAASTVSVPGTITVRVAVSDDHAVETVSITLNAADGIPIAPTISVAVGASSATIERQLSVTDERIASGNYTLTVRAQDGENETRAYRGITVQAAPLRLRAVFIVPPAGTVPATITRIDSVGGVSAWTPLSEANNAAVDGYSQHLFVAGGTNGPLSALATANSSSAWQVANQNTLPIPYFTGLSVDPADGRVYASTNDGTIRGWTGTGAQTFTAQAMAAFRPFASVVSDGELVSEQRGIVLPERRLVTYAMPHGAQLTHHPLDLEVVALFNRNDRVMVFGNRDGDGVVQERNLATGGVFEMQVFPGTPLRAVTSLDENTFILALPGEMTRFNASTTAVAGISAFTADALAYEAATGTLYAGAGSTLQLMDPANGAVTGTFALGTPIGHILPLLNR